MASADQWRWTDEDGVQRLLSADELRAAILEGRLKPSTLVWKRGMKAWAPAEAVPELMEEIEKSQGARIPPSLGPKAPKSSSIPDPSTNDELTDRRMERARPANLVDIASLRAQQVAHGGRATLHGFSVDESAVPAAARSNYNIAIPPAPKVPDLSGVGGFSKDASQDGSKDAERRNKLSTTEIDGLWGDAAARSGDVEDTVTKVRDDEERTNVAPNPKLDRATQRGSSAPPPPKRGSNPAPDSRAPPPPKSRRLVARPKPASTLVSTGDAPQLGVRRQPVIDLATARAAQVATHPLGGMLPVTHVIPDERAGSSNPGATNPGSSNPGTGATLNSEMAERRPRALTAPLPAILRPDAMSQPHVAAQSANAPSWQAPDPNLSAQLPPASSSPAPMGLVDLDPGAANLSGFLVDSGEPARPTVTPFSQRATRKLGDHLLPQQLLWATAGAGALLLMISFGAGRCSGAGARSVVAPARAGWASVPLFARSRARIAEPRPCLMASAPARWSYQAAKAVPIELVPTADGKLAIGYARSPNEVRGLVVDPATGVIVTNYAPNEKTENLARVSPMPTADGVTFPPITTEQDGLRNAVYLRAAKPTLIGVAGDQLVMVPEAGAQPKPLWKLPGPIDRLQVAPFGPQAKQGFGVVYLTGDRVWYGAVKPDGGVMREPAALESSARVGKPMIASNGREVSVVFADGNPGEQPIQLRWARAAVGASLDKAPVVELPAGGPGGDAIAPDIAAVSGGRWLLMWTEGKEGVRALRAQSYDRQGGRLGAALRVSPETGNFGQGTVTLVGETVAVAFLLKNDKSYQLWGTVLQCR